MVAYFLDELELHKEVLTEVLNNKSDDYENRKHWTSELTAISRRIEWFEHASGSKRSKAVKDLKDALKVRKYTVQKRSDLTPEQQRPGCFKPFTLKENQTKHQSHTMDFTTGRSTYAHVCLHLRSVLS